MMAPATAGAPSAMVAASTRRLAGQACLTGSLLRLINRAGLMIGSAVALGTLAAEFGQLSPEPGEEMIAQILLALKRDLIRSIPCRIVESGGYVADWVWRPELASSLHLIASYCDVASSGTGSKNSKVLMKVGGKGKSKSPTLRVDGDPKVHGNLPNHVPQTWSRGYLREIAHDLVKSNEWSRHIGAL